jgi:hypothetical protein
MNSLCRMCVITHDVPQNRSSADRHHRLKQWCVARGAHAHARPPQNKTTFTLRLLFSGESRSESRGSANSPPTPGHAGGVPASHVADLAVLASWRPAKPVCSNGGERHATAMVLFRRSDRRHVAVPSRPPCSPCWSASTATEPASRRAGGRRAGGGGAWRARLGRVSHRAHRTHPHDRECLPDPDLHLPAGDPPLARLDERLWEIVGTGLWNTSMPFGPLSDRRFRRLPADWGQNERDEVAFGFRSLEGLEGRWRDSRDAATTRRSVRRTSSSHPRIFYLECHPSRCPKYRAAAGSAGGERSCGDLHCPDG